MRTHACTLRTRATRRRLRTTWCVSAQAERAATPPPPPAPASFQAGVPDSCGLSVHTAPPLLTRGAPPPPVQDKIKLNKQLPYLVGNVVEILDQVPEVRSATQIVLGAGAAAAVSAGAGATNCSCCQRCGACGEAGRVSGTLHVGVCTPVKHAPRRFAQPQLKQTHA